MSFICNNIIYIILYVQLLYAIHLYTILLNTIFYIQYINKNIIIYIKNKRIKQEFILTKRIKVFVNLRRK